MAEDKNRQKVDWNWPIGQITFMNRLRRTRSPNLVRIVNLIYIQTEFRRFNLVVWSKTRFEINKVEWLNMKLFKEALKSSSNTNHYWIKETKKSQKSRN